MDAARRRQTLTEAFAEHFGGAPSVWVRAPGRVDLMGSHTDYNLGYVLALAIDRDTWIAAAPRADRTVRVFSLNIGELASFAPAHPPETSGWEMYVYGVVRVLADHGFGAPGRRY